MNSYLSFALGGAVEMIRFTNVDHKSWIVPTRGISIALGLYQPSSLRGRVLKYLLPYLYWSKPLRRVINAEEMQVDLNPQIKQLLRHVLAIDNFDFSIFEGTPSIHQKVTIQISHGGRIIAYCKLSEDIDIVSLFWREQMILGELRRRGVGSIPQCYYCGRVDAMGDTTIFVQSTIKSSRSRVEHHWSAKHQYFIEELRLKTKRWIEFERSDFARSLRSLERYLDVFTVAQRMVVLAALERVREHYGAQRVEFSALHGDFTPWNSCVERGELFVFDFEYAGLTYPPYLDRYHFITQSALYECGVNSSMIYSEYLKSGGDDIAYSSYLLDIISKYIHRERGEMSDSTRRNIELWIEILDMLWS